METRKCECGCGENIPAFGIRKKPRRFALGHSSRVRQRGKNRHAENIMIPCGCGCGEEINSFDVRGRPRRYIRGHKWNGKHDEALAPAREKRRLRKDKLALHHANHRRRRKVKLIKLKGSVCEDCGLKYDGENGALFQFHHLEPEKKLFAINLGTLGNPWNLVLEEAEKCVLLCANCHSLEHSVKF